jgi:hypothetical protein
MAAKVRSRRDGSAVPLDATDRRPSGSLRHRPPQLGWRGTCSCSPRARICRGTHVRPAARCSGAAPVSPRPARSRWCQRRRRPPPACAPGSRRRRSARPMPLGRWQIIRAERMSRDRGRELLSVARIFHDTYAEEAARGFRHRPPAWRPRRPPPASYRRRLIPGPPPGSPSMDSTSWASASHSTERLPRSRSKPGAGSGSACSLSATAARMIATGHYRSARCARMRAGA